MPDKEQENAAALDEAMLAVISTADLVKQYYIYMQQSNIFTDEQALALTLNFQSGLMLAGKNQGG